jgi:prepilin-type N-terminal cleavage/methylation domain-containing protein
VASGRWPCRAAFSLVELLVVLAILAILLALLLPAIQAAREAARTTQCTNQIRQLGLAMEVHLTEFRRYPSNGWGHLWIGHPDRGTGEEQPGGWIYNLLPYVEQQSLRDRGRNLSWDEQRRELTELSQIPLPMLACPSRAAGSLSPAAPRWVPRDADWVAQVAKSDYAVNGGDLFLEPSVWEGPLTLADGDAGNYAWIDRSRPTGICFQRSEITPAMVSDGLSHTFLIGEKHVSRRHYATADDEGYNESMYHGSSLDITRWVDQPLQMDGEAIRERSFGSAHHAGACFVLGDGSVRLIPYHVDSEVYRRLGNRCDGQPLANR